MSSVIDVLLDLEPPTAYSARVLPPYHPAKVRLELKTTKVKPTQPSQEEGMKNADSPQFATVYIIGGSGLKAPEDSSNLPKKKKGKRPCTCMLHRRVC